MQKTAPVKTLAIDLETYSPVDIKRGLDNYAPSAEILCFAYSANGAPPEVWDCTATPRMPDALADALDDEETLILVHNATFEEAILRHAGYVINPARYLCSMMKALVHALPPSLDELGRVLGLPPDSQKLKRGTALINLFCKPLPKNRKIRRATRDTHPTEWAEFLEYCRKDVVALLAVWDRIPSWNYTDREIALWQLDQRINRRGFQVDVELANAGAAAAASEKEYLTTRFAELTHGLAPTQRAKVQAFLNERFGLSLTSTARDVLEPISNDLTRPAELREIASIILAANKTSTAKYAAIANAVSPDGRFRYGLQFAGAGRTKRWSGRLFQPQNLPSRGLPSAESIEQYIACLKDGVHDLIFDNLMLYGAAALRGLVVATPGKKLAAADLSNIEGRLLAWFADEAWKIQAFRDYDAGTGPDLYNITANMIIGVDPWEVPKKDRNVFGKVPDLASGYQGGVAGYQTFARAYGVCMADHWDTIQQSIDGRHIVKARENYLKWGATQAEDLGISELEWVASETCKLAWRAKHAATVKLWYDLQDAVKNAINTPGKTYQVGKLLKVGVRKHKGIRWLLIKLPSGSYITYFDPRLTEDGSISYMGMASDEGSTTRAWVRCFTHGGKLTGNVCQHTARDLLADTMQSVEDAGYDILLSIHDELVTEVPEGNCSAAEVARIISTNPPWAKGLPLAAAGFEAYRYRKD